METLTKKTRIETDFIRKSLRIESKDKAFEFEMGMKYLVFHFSERRDELKTKREFWNWWKLQWNNRSKSTLEFLSISPDHNLSIIDKQALHGAYIASHKKFMCDEHFVPTNQFIKSIING